MTDFEALRVLRLEAGASEEEIAQAFRRLAKVWHPDRFMDDPQLRARAQDRLREIIAARQTLRGYAARRTRPGGGGATENRGWRPPPPPPGGWPETGRRKAKQRKPRRHPLWALLVCAGLVLGLVRAVNLAELAAIPQMAVQRVLPAPQEASPAPVPAKTALPVKKPAPPEKNAGAASMARSAAKAAPAGGSPHFTLGSSQAQVEAAQGPPSSADDWVWRYGASSVYFSQGRVAGWETSPQNPLKAQMPPKGAAGHDLAYFTLGSSSEELLAAQGAPSILDPTVWRYGLSKVYLHEGRVTGWDIASEDPLKARMLPSDPSAKNRGFFSVGSSADEVLAAQGTPSGVSERVWKYGASSVYFSEGRVSSWDMHARHPLKARMLPSSAASSYPRPYFTVGSSADEVIAIQGTPTSFNDTAWRYGRSTVYFKDGRVLRWYSSPGNPIRAKLRSELMFKGY